MGKCQGQAGSSSADVVAGAPLGGYFGHDEYRAGIPRSANATRAGDQSGAFDIAGARHVSRWRQFSVLANLLSGTRDGSRRAGDRVVQAVRPVFRSSRNIADWTWHGILATPDGQAHCRLAAIRPLTNACVVSYVQFEGGFADAFGWIESHATQEELDSLCAEARLRLSPTGSP